jgi:hypothetical protein
MLQNTTEEMVFQQWRHVAEQWCFNNGEKKGEKLLNNGVSAMGKKRGKK